MTIQFNAKVTPTFTQLNSVCEDYNPLADLPTSSSDTPAITGTWAMTTDNTTNKVYTFTPDANQCANSTTMTITVNPSTNFDLTLSNIVITGFDMQVLMASSTVVFEYSLDSISWQASTNFYNLENGLHTLFVQDAYGCVTKSLQFRIDAFEIPKFFTPNGDGSNDVWQIEDHTNQIKHIVIFDRFGKQIAIIYANQGWDGNYLGQPLTSTDYWYLIVFKDGLKQSKIGHFSLKV